MNAANQDNIKRALSVSRPSRSGCGGVVASVGAFLFCAAFFAAGAIVAWFATIGPTVEILLAQSWNEVPCKVLSSEVVGDDTYAVVIRYEYEINQQQHEGNRYSFFTARTSGRAGKQKIVDQYPPGSAASCYVDPSEASRSVLNRNFTLHALWGLFGIPFMLVGLGGFYAIFFSKRKASAVNTGDEDFADDFEDDRLSATSPIVDKNHEFTEYNLREEPGPITLTNSESPIGGFIGLLVFALCWNGFVAAFAYFARAADWMAGKWQFLPDLIIVGFGMVGLLIIFATIHAFLKLFNPKPVLILSRSAIPLGGNAELTWHFEGGSGSIRQLTIKLQGQEQVTYVQGTDTKRDESTFHEAVLLDTTEQVEIASGSVSVTVPTDSMHSFTAPNNKIVWQIHFQGHIANWPDVTSKNSLRVVPHE